MKLINLITASPLHLIEPQTTKIGYKFGLSGSLLFNAILYQTTQKEVYFDKCSGHIQLIYNLIQQNQLEGRIHEELTDFGRVLFYLIQNDLIADEDAVIFFEQIDNILIEETGRLHQSADFHICSGMLALAYYYLECYKNKKTFKQEIAKIVHWFSAIAIKDIYRDGVYFENLFFDKKVYLGSIHGNLSIFRFLYQCKELDIEAYSSQELMQKIINYIIGQINHDETGLDMFSEFIGKKKGDQTLQLVYGQFNVLYSLYKYASQYIPEKIYQEIEKNLEAIAKYQNSDVVCINESLAYGSMGISLMFKNLYKHSGKIEFENAYLYWLSESIKNTQKKQLFSPKQGNNDIDFGFFTGLTGIYSSLALTEISKENILNDFLFL